MKSPVADVAMELDRPTECEATLPGAVPDSSFSLVSPALAGCEHNNQQ